MGKVLRIGAAVAVILIALIPGIYGWRTAGPVSMSWQGWAALIGGAVVTALLGGGLMALVFYSNRRGYDTRADNAVASMDRPQDGSVGNDDLGNAANRELD
jgi:hypothetical protein